jgi:hypothetical protein
MGTTTRESQELALKAVAFALGEDPENITLIAPDWVQTMRRGVIVAIHVRRWRAKSKLDLEDLGLGSQTKEVSQLLELGYKRLLPKKLMQRLDAVESNLRKNLTKYSTKTKWGELVGERSYQDWKESHTRWVEEYMGILDYILTNWETIIRDLTGEYKAEADRSYFRLRALYTAEVKRYNDGESQTPPAPLPSRESFVRAYVGRILDRLPSREDFTASFGVETDLSYIPLPSLLEEDLQQAETVRAKAEAERAITEAERQMRQDVLQQAKAQKEELVFGFMRDLVKDLRETAYNATVDVLDSIKRNGNLQPRSVVQLRTMAEQIQALNFFGDQEIDKMIAPIQQILNQRAGDRDLGDIETKLRDVALVTRAQLIELGEPAIRSAKIAKAARTVGVEQIPSPEVLRKSRVNLGLTIESPQAAGERKRRAASGEPPASVIPSI